jgi:hypothetical protein
MNPMLTAVKLCIKALISLVKMKNKSSAFGRIHLLMTDFFQKSFFIGQNWPCMVTACSSLKKLFSHWSELIVQAL